MKSWKKLTSIDNSSPKNIYGTDKPFAVIWSIAMYTLIILQSVAQTVQINDTFLTFIKLLGNEINSKT